MSLFDLTGRRALVTGASRGLGRAMALALAEAGADVACVASRVGGADATADAVRAAGREAWSLAADFEDRDAVAGLAVDAETSTGGVDILVNNAGAIRRAPAAETPDADWDAVLEINLNALFRLTRDIGAGMLARGRGKVINVASLLSFQGGLTVPAYAASKHAVAGVTKALANEWAARNVQVNAIAPGYFRTDNTAALQADETRSRQIGERIPAGRWGDPADLAGPVTFLAAPASDYLSGHVLVVDGGWLAR